MTEWGKELGEKLTDFTLVNIIVYLVYGRDKTFDMHALRAHKSLKAYKFFYDGFAKNVWVYECQATNDLSPRVLYFRAFVYHSLLVMLPWKSLLL